MDSHLLLRNRQVHRLVVGVPEGEDRIHARLETASGDVITLQEDTLEALCRAYLSVSTHPRQRAMEMRTVPAGNKTGEGGSHRLVETPADEGLLRAEMAAVPMSEEGWPTQFRHPDSAHTADPGDQTERLSRKALEKALAEHKKADEDRGQEPPQVLEELELDETGDGPIFGGIPTVHSRPGRKRDEDDHS